MTEATETPQPAAEVLPSVGERLMQARLSQGLSLGEMARQLKLSVKQVEALERDDYRSFPGALWVRGFLRNYAKVLGLDADALVAKAGLAPQVVQGEAGAAVSTSTPASAGRERRRLVVLILAFVILGLLVLGLLGKRAGRHVEPPAGAPAPNGSASPAASTAPATTTPVPLTVGPPTPAAPDPNAPAQLPASQMVSPPVALPDASGVLPPAGSVADPASALPSGVSARGPESALPPGGGTAVTPSGSPAQAVQSAVLPPAPVSSAPPAAAPTQPSAGANAAAKPDIAKPLSGVASAPQIKAAVPAGAPPAQAPAATAQTEVPRPQSAVTAKSPAGVTATPVPAPAQPAAVAPAAPGASSVDAKPGMAAASEPGAPAAEAPTPEVKPRTLRLTFTQSVEVRVVDANGKVLIGSLQAAGSEKSVRGLPPFAVSIGNVHAVKLLYRGREIDLTSRGRTGSAKLTLQ